MKRVFLKIYVTIVCVAAMLALQIPSLAVPVDMSAAASLTITLAPGGKPLADSEFKLYRIADISRNGSVTLTAPFSGFPIVFEKENADDLRKLALTLKGYVISEKIEPDYTGVTNSSGTVSFSDIPLGMYLVVGSSVTVDGTTYIPETFVITLPAEAEGENWEYNVNVRTKALMGNVDETVDLRVLKVWDDNGDGSSRPEKITVELYSVEELFDTVTLSKENNWHHTWLNLNGIDWTIVEKDVPEGYKVSVERDGNSFIVTNTKADDTTENSSSTFPHSTNPDSSTPDSTVSNVTTLPSVDNTTVGGEFGETETTAASGGNDTPPADNESKPSLPQTGMLWWPVPMFALIGVVLLLMGWRINRRFEDEI